MPYDLNTFEKKTYDIKLGKVNILDEEAAEKAYSFRINNLDIKTKYNADNRMLTHNDNLAFAKARYEHMQDLYDLAKDRIDMWRTKEASSRF